MRLAIACHRYHPVPGGSERIAQLLAEAASRRGDRVTVITQEEPGVPDREDLNGVSVVRLPMRRIAGVRVPVGYLTALRETRGDLFHLHGNRIWCADFYLPMAGRFSWPSVGTGHGFYQYAVDRKPWDRPYFELYFPWAIRHLDRYVCDTEFERAQLTGWGVPSDRLALIPLGANAAEFSEAPTDPGAIRAHYGIRAPHVAVSVGGLFRNKRIDRLLDGVALTRGSWALLVLGRDLPGSPFDRAQCAARARALGVEFVAPGVVPRDEVVRALQAADAVVQGSEYEGFGVALAEGLAAGRPFVAWPAGAATEMAARGAGRIVRTVEEFASALKELEDPARASEAAARARAEAADWTESRMVERYLALYDALAERRGG